MVDQDNPVVDFTAEDRCDRCGAQAYHLARHDEYGELMFCNHCMEPRGDRYQLMIDEGWEIVSNLEALDRLYGTNVYPMPV